ncbi:MULTISPECIES: ABC-F family ATP-binding cassette domain-containing protein [unclassified Oscillibacter]|uniref:ABC-F family ATP-binding cassette domain-containing protein n=1 Tax=unclassified Oscillibacter TaxID=2629304 RepID=UPI0025D9D8D5|nr:MULTISPECIES: ABC-F family ATP-binding cassette domain-containing protein [unclassified Oscillibacter]
MITVSEVSLNFSGQALFKDVNLKFTSGNCYGIIGANGAGKTTFLRILSGELEPTTGDVFISDNQRMSVLKQDHFQYDEHTVLDTVIMGNQRLYDIMKEKDALYEKEDFSDADGVHASELEAEFADMDGWESESDASRLIQGLGLSNDILYSQMSSLTAKEKVKVLLAQALFGKPDIILLDEPTNHLDLQAIEWLENFLMDYEGLIIVVSHDRYFLNNVCTSIVDVDYGKIRMYVGNYEFWYESSQMVQKMMKDQNRKNEDKIKELQLFIQRFSANKSKSKQATSRRKLLDKLTVDEMPASSRRYPFVGFTLDREPGKEILTVEGLNKTIDGRQLLNDVSFRVNKGDKIAFVGENELAKTTLFRIIMEELEADAGSFKWGTTISTSYFPLDNSAFFNDCNLNLVEWLGQYTADNAEENTESFKRSFLGRMLFSGDDVFKAVKVLSGGEKVRCMLSRMMLFGSNALVLDQPTNHLDLESITAVNKGLIEYKGVVLFASHDHEFVQTVANRIIDFQSDGTIIDKACTYDDYIELQKAGNAR